MDNSIDFQKVNFAYQQTGLTSNLVLKNINLKIPANSFTAIVGKTGSGKSTLVQHINGLLKPTSGRVKIGKTIINNKTSDKKLFNLRKKVGMVFQFPEHQLFEDTVLKDVIFGPKNMGYSNEKAINMAKSSLRSVHFPNQLFNQSPFNLSGGQMRRVAIADILVMNPEIMILDEPTAGLDYLGKRSIMNLIYDLYKKRHLTIIMVTHQMNDVAKYANDVIVMHDGHIVSDTSPQKLFENKKLVEENNLEMPDIVNFSYQLKDEGINLSQIPLTIENLTDVISKKLKK